MFFFLVGLLESVCLMILNMTFSFRFSKVIRMLYLPLLCFWSGLGSRICFLMISESNCSTPDIGPFYWKNSCIESRDLRLLKALFSLLWLLGLWSSNTATPFYDLS